VKSDALLEEWDKTNKRKDLVLLSYESLESFRSSLTSKETNNKPLDVESVKRTYNALAKLNDKNCREIKDLFYISLVKKRIIGEEDNECTSNPSRSEIGETAVV